MFTVDSLWLVAAVIGALIGVVGTKWYTKHKSSVDTARQEAKDEYAKAITTVQNDYKDVVNRLSLDVQNVKKDFTEGISAVRQNMDGLHDKLDDIRQIVSPKPVLSPAPAPGEAEQPA